MGSGTSAGWSWARALSERASARELRDHDVEFAPGLVDKDRDGTYLDLVGVFPLNDQTTVELGVPEVALLI